MTKGRFERKSSPFHVVIPKGEKLRKVTKKWEKMKEMQESLRLLRMCFLVEGFTALNIFWMKKLPPTKSKFVLNMLERMLTRLLSSNL